MQSTIIDIPYLCKLLKKKKQEKVKVYGLDEYEYFSCRFNDPVNLEDIESFERQTNCSLPEDYKEFLGISNGMKFFVSGELDLYSLDEIRELLLLMEYKSGVIPIGYILEDVIVINCNESKDKCLYVGSHILYDEFMCFGYDFATFMANYIMLNYTKFWSYAPPVEQEYTDFERK